MKGRTLAGQRQFGVLGWLLAAAFLLLAAGVTLPILETRVLLSHDKHSLLDIAMGLFQQKDFVLAFVIIAFSIILPFGKLIMLAMLHIYPSPSRSGRGLRVLEAVSRWAMLDVLVIALVIVSLKSAVFANAFTMPGFYFFAAAAMLSHILSHRIIKRCRLSGRMSAS